jgi:hypothetical protein
MKTENKATPRPWKVQDTEYPEFVIAPDEMVVCQMRGWGALQHKFDNPTDIANVQKANAELIVKAVNAYDSLVEENKQLKIDASNWAYQCDRAKQERDKAEAENQKLREALTEIRNDLDDVGAYDGTISRDTRDKLDTILETKAKNV